MPFVRGRYYVNPIVGGAIEAAREADEASQSENDQAENPGSDSNQIDPDSKPIRRIEIEIAETVPAHSGQATKGYVAQIHRVDTIDTDPILSTSASRTGEKRIFYDPGQLVKFLSDELAKHGNCR
jgi:hypothetical protein